MDNSADIGRQEYEAAVRAQANHVYAHIWDFMKSNRSIDEEHLLQITGSYLEHRGKCLRPALLAFCCQAAGGSMLQAVPAGASVEMFHTWTLMHDDVIDHDDMRRGHPTAHVRGEHLACDEMGLLGQEAREYGMDLAILGGDLLQSLAIGMMLSLPCKPQVTIALARRVCCKISAELLSGEQLDVRLSMTPWNEISEISLMKMMRLKTGALLAFCAEAGVAIAQNELPGESGMARKMVDFAHLCGLAFQMKDDLLGVFGDKAQFGKPIGSDIREGKRTVLMLKTLDAASIYQRKRIFDVLGRSDAEESEIADVRTIVQNTGADAAVAEMSDAFVFKALDILHGIKGDSQALKLLEKWALAMVDRNI